MLTVTPFLGSVSDETTATQLQADLTKTQTGPTDRKWTGSCQEVNGNEEKRLMRVFCCSVIGSCIRNACKWVESFIKVVVYREVIKTTFFSKLHKTNTKWL